MKAGRILYREYRSLWRAAHSRDYLLSGCDWTLFHRRSTHARIQTQLIDDLLDMSRIISGKIRLDVQRVDLAEVVQAAVDSVRYAADAKAIRLSGPAPK